MYDEYLSLPDLQKILELSSHRPMFHTQFQPCVSFNIDSESVAKWPNKTVHSPFFVWRQTDGWREQELQPRLLSIIVDLFYRRSADFYCLGLGCGD